MKHIILDEEMNDKSQERILLKAKNKKYFNDFAKLNIQLTKKNISESVSEDSLLIIAVHYFDDLQQISQALLKRLKDASGYYVPELKVDDDFLDIVSKPRNQIFKILKMKDSMGVDISKLSKDQIKDMASTIQRLLQDKDETKKYISKLSLRIMPNTTAIVGPEIAARLIGYSGSLKRFAFHPASTIQLLGAHKALFRHLEKGTKNPKYGILFTHPLVKHAKQKDKGKIARLIADKLAIAAKVDYFKGDFIGEKLLKTIEEQICK